MPENFLCPQRDQPMLMPVDMREWLPEDDLVFVVLDAVAALDLGEFRRRYRADGHGRAAFDPEMMVALLLYGYCQGERSSRVIEKRCVRDVAYRVIAGGLVPIMPPLPGSGRGMRRRWAGCSARCCGCWPPRAWCRWGCSAWTGPSWPATRRKGEPDAAADRETAGRGGRGRRRRGRPVRRCAGRATPRALARRAERRERLARARDRLAAEDAARREAQRAKQEAWDAAAAAGGRGRSAPGRRAAQQPQQH